MNALLTAIIECLKGNRRFADFFERRTAQQLVRYLLVGSLSFVMEWSLLFCFHKVFGLWYLYANSAAFIIVFWLNFLLNRFWSFQSQERFGRQILLYGILCLVNLGISNLMMFALHGFLKIEVMIAKVFAVALIVSWNFILYKKVIYK